MLALFGRPLTTGQRRFLLFVTHLGLAALSNWLAFVLRFDEDIPAEQWNLLVTWLPWLLVIRALAFYRFRLYDGLWRYTSLWDIRNLVLGIAASTAVFAGVVRFGLGIAAYPASVFVVDALVLLCLQTGMRVAPRVMREFPWIGKGRNRVLVVGAGDAGA